MKVAVIYKKSVWDLFSRSRDPNINEFMCKESKEIESFKVSHRTQTETIGSVKNVLDEAGNDVRMIYRSELSNSVTEDIDLAVTVGGDGTFLETSHFIKGNTPILGVNSDPMRSVGFFCACNGNQFKKLFTDLENIPRTLLSRVEMSIDGTAISPPILNDVLFANPNPAATTRYRIEEKKFRNSGLLITTAAGSTGWAFQEGCYPMPLEDNRFQYYPRGTRNSSSELASSLKIESLTRKGKLFIDGEHCSVPLCIGQSLELRSGAPISVIGNLSEKRSDFLEKHGSSS